MHVPHSIMAWRLRNWSSVRTVTSSTQSASVAVCSHAPIALLDGFWITSRSIPARTQEEIIFDSSEYDLTCSVRVGTHVFKGTTVINDTGTRVTRC